MEAEEHCCLLLLVYQKHPLLLLLLHWRPTLTLMLTLAE